MLSSVTLIIHNAWRLDFNLSVASFEDNIKGTTGLLDLALSSTNLTRPRVIFISSVGTIGRWGEFGRTPAIPEEPIQEPRISTGSGYSASKYVVEKVRAAMSESKSVFLSAQRCYRFWKPLA